MGSWGGPRHYQGAGLGPIGKWTCPSCGTEHVTPLEGGCSVCLAEDTRREKAVADTMVGVEKLGGYLLPATQGDPNDAALVRGEFYTEVARQSLAAALAHFVEHGSPDASLLPKAVMIGWARELAGLGEDQE